LFKNKVTIRRLQRMKFLFHEVQIRRLQNNTKDCEQWISEHGLKLSKFPCRVTKRKRYSIVIVRYTYMLDVEKSYNSYYFGDLKKAVLFKLMFG
jgi:hypothetical protein